MLCNCSQMLSQEEFLKKHFNPQVVLSLASSVYIREQIVKSFLDLWWINFQQQRFLGTFIQLDCEMSK